MSMLPVWKLKSSDLMTVHQRLNQVRADGSRSSRDKIRKPLAIFPRNNLGFS
jgi:hypothetical protein